MPQAILTKPLSICFVHDDRIGHQKQLKGLENQLLKQTHCTTHWVDVNMAKSPKALTLHFDIVIGAGNKTHWPLWRLARKQRAFSAVLMRPSLPKCMYDAVICPRHDGQKESKRVFNTQGPINAIETTAADARVLHNLILLGGPSKHFHWNPEQIRTSISQLSARYKDLPWLVLPSRRTPDTTINTLKAHLPDVHVLSTDKDINPLIQHARQIWVSADSSNMIFESITAGKPTGIIELAPRIRRFKSNRLDNELKRLLQEKRLMTLSLLADTETVNNRQPAALNEAERAAKWLLKRYQNWLREQGRQSV